MRWMADIKWVEESSSRLLGGEEGVIFTDSVDDYIADESVFDYVKDEEELKGLMTEGAPDLRQEGLFKGITEGVSDFVVLNYKETL
tara:strand:- start:63 stop:320 length:258 start_codon:yes stop_codon:yes gene_type:complete